LLLLSVLEIFSRLAVERLYASDGIGSIPKVWCTTKKIVHGRTEAHSGEKRDDELDASRMIRRILRREEIS